MREEYEESDSDEGDADIDMVQIAPPPFNFDQMTTTTYARFFVRVHGGDFLLIPCPSSNKSGDLKLLVWDGDVWNPKKIGFLILLFV